MAKKKKTFENESNEKGNFEVKEEKEVVVDDLEAKNETYYEDGDMSLNDKAKVMKMLLVKMSTQAAGGKVHGHNYC